MPPEPMHADVEAILVAGLKDMLMRTHQLLRRPKTRMIGFRSGLETPRTRASAGGKGSCT